MLEWYEYALVTEITIVCVFKAEWCSAVNLANVCFMMQSPHTHDSTLPMNTRTHLSVLLHFNWLWCDTRLIIAANGPTQQPLGHQRLSWRAPREPHALLHAMALINRARGLYNGPVHSWMSKEEGCYIHTVRLHLSSAVVLLKRPQGTSPVLPGLVTASR